jgi:hypothetical protein
MRPRTDHESLMIDRIRSNRIIRELEKCTIARLVDYLLSPESDVLRCVASGGRGAAHSQFAGSSGIGQHHTRVESNPTDLRPALLLYWAIGAHVRIHTSTNALYGVRPMSIRGLERWHTLPTPVPALHGTI